VDTEGARAIGAMRDEARGHLTRDFAVQVDAGRSTIEN
jgi:hypothetical protein